MLFEDAVCEFLISLVDFLLKQAGGIRFPLQHERHTVIECADNRLIVKWYRGINFTIKGICDLGGRYWGVCPCFVHNQASFFKQSLLLS